FNLLCFAILVVVDRKMTKGAFPGRLAAMYLMLYAVGRSAIETFRGDADRGLYFGGALSFSQIVSILVFLGGFALWRALRSRRAATPAPPSAPAA
ncbi:MAG TPA: prolipoprotein diacylglyceryl transferase family protein, partial [Planctomycetota bacterium]|nr:prolipoprotein diacylglyceryl transferase family protein [Planctomycetota bacterium]